MSIIRYNGSLQDVPQITSSTISGTWVTGDKARATIGNAFVEITLGSSIAVTDVASELATAINATDKTTGLVDETRNIGGQTKGEFRDVVASASGADLILTSSRDGLDFIVSFSKTSTSGVMGAATEVQAATGKNWFDKAGNWDGGVAPGSGDIALFSDSDVDCNRGLNTIANIDGVTRLGSYTGNIGLPLINEENYGYPYQEYRNRYLLVDKASDGSIIRIGDGSGNSTGLTKINNYQHNAYYYINDTAVQDQKGINPIEIISDDGGTGGGVHVVVTKGDVDIGERNGDYTAGFGCEIEHILVLDGNVRIEGQVEASSELTIYGGNVETHMELVDFTADLILQGGKLTHRSGACPAITVGSGATLDYQSDTGPTGNITVEGGGTLTFDNNQQVKDMTNISIILNNGSIFSDIIGVAVPSGTGTYQLVNTTTNENIKFPKNHLYAPTPASYAVLPV